MALARVDSQAAAACRGRARSRGYAGRICSQATRQGLRLLVASAFESHHETATFFPVSIARVEASTSRKSRRSAIISMAPVSSRNSER